MNLTIAVVSYICLLHLPRLLTRVVKLIHWMSLIPFAKVTGMSGQVETRHNNRMHSDNKKRRSLVALLFAASDEKRRTTTRIKPTSAVKAFGFSVLAAYPPPR